MATAVTASVVSRTLQDTEVKQKLQELRRPDNVRNLLYLVRTYLLLIATVAGTVYFYTHRADWGLNWAWNVPVTFLATVLVGMGQHQLSVLTHEASHHILFRTRLYNELMSDVFCMFPMFSTTHHYRMQHVAHHQFVNDPELDPNVPQLTVNGHWTRFPMTRATFWRELAKQVWPPNLIRYLRAQAKSNSVGAQANPYLQPALNPRGNRFARAAGVAYLFILTYGLLALALLGWAEWIVPLALVAWLAIGALYVSAPSGWFFRTRIHPTYPIRWLSILRITSFTLFAVGLAWLTAIYGWRAILVVTLLWFVPMATSFSFFMMMRQLVQHANAGRGFLSNTRVFLVNLFWRDSILPYGQDYHLPHHMFATIPHYRLRELHEFLMTYPEYRDEAVVVHGAVLSRSGHYPSIVDVLGPDWDRRRGSAHIDNSVLDDEAVDERGEIDRIAAASAGRTEPPVS
ncbi:MAG: fatty acid desaturase [Gemmataceae bacterium]